MQVLSSTKQRGISAAMYFVAVGLITVSGMIVSALVSPSLSYSFRPWSVNTREEVTPDSFYTKRVAPLLAEHCVSCHGPRRRKAKLRLDSYEEVIKGGRHGPVIIPNELSKSSLVTRINLPPTDMKAMPPEGRSSLQSDDVKAIEAWIAAGASATQSADSVKGAPPVARQVSIPTTDPRAVAAVRAPLAALVHSAKSRFPSTINYASRNSAYVEINASLIGSSFHDVDLESLLPLQACITRLDLSATAITDASAGVLAKMTALRVLRLASTRITDVTVKAVSNLPELESLSIVGTRATEDSIEPLRRRGIVVYASSANVDSVPSRR